MSRPVILITTGRNVYSLRAYDAILAACVRLDLQFDVAHVDKERLTAKPVQTLLRHPLCVKKHVVKSNLIQEYRALSGFAAERDIRPELAKMYERIIPKLLKDNAEFVKALDEAPWVFTGHGIFSKPFIDQKSPKLIQYNQLSLLQHPAANLGSTKHKANYLMVDRGGMLGESPLATNPSKLPELLRRHHVVHGDEAIKRANKVILDVIGNRYTEHASTEKAPGVQDWYNTVFVPLHCAWDAQMLRYSPFFGRNQEFLQFIIDHTDDNTKILVKPHPKGTNGLKGKVDPVVKAFENHPKVTFTSANVHDIFRKVGGVITLNSSVGLEAVLHHLPVVVLGKAFYGHITGATFSARDIEHAKELVRTGWKAPTDKHMAKLAIDFFWNHYLVPVTPAAAFNKRVYSLVAARMKEVT